MILLQFELNCEKIVLSSLDTLAKGSAKNKTNRPYRMLMTLLGVVMAVAISAVVATILTFQSEIESTEAPLPCEFLLKQLGISVINYFISKFM